MAVWLPPATLLYSLEEWGLREDGWEGGKKNKSVQFEFLIKV
jgi:hypothetical protein